MKKRLIIAICIMLLIITGLGVGIYMVTVQQSDNGSVNHKADEQETKNMQGEESAVTVEFSHSMENNIESAVFTGMDADGNEVWRHETEEYPAATPEGIWEVGIYKDHYYYTEMTKLYALNMTDGSVAWINEDIGGGGVNSVIGDDGRIYVCGYYDSDLTVVDYEGRTLHKIDRFEDYIWPWGLKCNDEYLLFEMDDEEPVHVIVSTFDYEYSIVSAQEWEIDEEDQITVDLIPARMTQIQLEAVATALGVASGGNVTITQKPPVYQKSSGKWLTYVKASTADGTEKECYVDSMTHQIEGAEQSLGYSEESASGTLVVPQVASVTASSSLSEYNMTHGPERVTDNDLATAWVEGAQGQGIGEYITVRLDQEYSLNGFKIFAGYQKSADIYNKNSRPKDITVIFADGTGQSYTLSDSMGQQDISFSNPVRTDSVTIVIDSVYPGSKYEDAAISGLTIY